MGTRKELLRHLWNEVINANLRYVDDIYAYLQARADGVLARGRPNKLEE
jgi:hypothetical protein